MICSSSLRLGHALQRFVYVACATDVVRSSKIVKKRKALNVLRPNMTSLLIFKDYVSCTSYEKQTLTAFERLTLDN